MSEQLKQLKAKVEKLCDQAKYELLSAVIKENLEQENKGASIFHGGEAHSLEQVIELIDQTLEEQNDD